MKKIIDYKVHTWSDDVDKDEFEQDIKTLLKEGWQPFNSVSTLLWNTFPVEIQYSQSWVKYEEGSDK